MVTLVGAGRREGCLYTAAECTACAVKHGATGESRPASAAEDFDCL